MEIKTRCIMVYFGLGGHGEEYIREGDEFGMNKGHLSGYDRPENWEPDKDVDYEKAVFIDKRKVLENHPEYAFQSPLCGVVAQDMGSVPQGMEEVVRLYNVGNLDTVTPSQYKTWWKDRGAITGELINGKIRWEGKQKVKEIEIER